MLSTPDRYALQLSSQRAQIAFALSCIEAAVGARHLRGARYEEWLERAWRRSSAPRSLWREHGWPRNFAEIDELLDPAVGEWGHGASDLLVNLFGAAHDVCEELLESRTTEHAIDSLVRQLDRHSVAPPSVEIFVRSPRSEMAGVGRSVLPAFFRRGVERESFLSALVAGLHSDIAIERREAAFAAAHLGMGSNDLAVVLWNLRHDADLEVRELAKIAFRAVHGEGEPIPELVPATPGSATESARPVSPITSKRSAPRYVPRTPEDEHLAATLRLLRVLAEDPNSFEELLAFTREASDPIVRRRAVKELDRAAAHTYALTAAAAALADDNASVRHMAGTVVAELPYSISRRLDALIHVVRHGESGRVAEAAGVSLRRFEYVIADVLTTRLLDSRSDADVVLAILPYSGDVARAVSTRLAFRAAHPSDGDNRDRNRELAVRVAEFAEPWPNEVRDPTWPVRDPAPEPRPPEIDRPIQFEEAMWLSVLRWVAMIGLLALGVIQIWSE